MSAGLTGKRALCPWGRHPQPEAVAAAEKG